MKKNSGTRKGPNSNNNIVAKHARKFNLPAVFKDKKKAAKRGEIKHKHQPYQIAA
ncbi:MAG: DUF7230 family protein [Cellvibrionaceae bacterium]